MKLRLNVSPSHAVVHVKGDKEYRIPIEEYRALGRNNYPSVVTKDQWEGCIGGKAVLTDATGTRTVTLTEAEAETYRKQRVLPVTADRIEITLEPRCLAYEVTLDVGECETNAEGDIAIKYAEQGPLGSNKDAVLCLHRDEYTGTAPNITVSGKVLTEKAPLVDSIIDGEITLKAVRANI